jgi:AcrR family transcriptional regulator
MPATRNAPCVAPAGRFYAAFGSKEKLFFEAVELYAETVGCRPIEALKSAATARAGVEAMLHEVVNICVGANTPRGCLMFLGAINCAPANQSVQDYMRPYRSRAPGLIRKRLERGRAEGDVPKGADLEQMVSLYASILYGAPVRARDGASRKTLLAAVTAAMVAWDQLASSKRRGISERSDSETRRSEVERVRAGRASGVKCVLLRLRRSSIRLLAWRVCS